MASLVNNGNIYGLIWTDSNRDPIRVRESLRTPERHLALQKKKQLEWGYENRNNKYFPEDEKHDPWVRKWYEVRRNGHRVLTAPEAIEEFIAYKTAAKGEEGWSPDNAVNEAYSMRLFARIIGDRPVNQIDKKDLERIYYRPSVNSDHTRNSNYISLNTFFNWCKERGYIKKKPVFKPNKPQSKIPKFIYPQDLEKLIEHHLEKKRPLWISLGWMILAGTGMRPIELANLKVQHVEQGSIIIGEDFPVKVLSERRIPLLFESVQAVQMLTDAGFRKRQKIKRDYLLGWKPNYSKQELSRVFTDSWKECFPDKSHRTLYNLKDMFAVRFLTDPHVPSPSGLRLNDLKEILGHASLETTQKYLKAIPFGTRIEGTVKIDPSFDKNLHPVTGLLHKEA